MILELKLRKSGNFFGVILPKEALAQLNVEVQLARPEALAIGPVGHRAEMAEVTASPSIQPLWPRPLGAHRRLETP
jgi:antitoxin component of MazEF toxin-antitoxin module